MLTESDRNCLRATSMNERFCVSKIIPPYHMFRILQTLLQTLNQFSLRNLPGLHYAIIYFDYLDLLFITCLNYTGLNLHGFQAGAVEIDVKSHMKIENENFNQKMIRRNEQISCKHSFKNRKTINIRFCMLNQIVSLLLSVGFLLFCFMRNRNSSFLCGQIKVKKHAAAWVKDVKGR